ncbi:hypothetical protein ACFL59_09915 [Planctomycetota bacterium]
MDANEPVGAGSSGRRERWLPVRSARRANRRRPRCLTVRLTATYFTRREKKRQKLESGSRPDLLEGTVPTQRQWRSHLSLLEQPNPIATADRFLAELQRGSIHIYAQVAEHFGVSRAKVCYYVALVTRLPAEFVEWLRAVNDPRVLRHLTERRLRPLTRIEDKDAQRSELAKLVEEALARAGNGNGRPPKLGVVQKRVALGGATGKRPGLPVPAARPTSLRSD